MGRKVLKSCAFLAASMTLVAPKALATGGLACTIDDANLAFAMFASTNRDHGTIVVMTEGTLTLKANALAKMGRTFKVEREHIIQQWFQQRELRIAVNIENDSGSLLLAIAPSPGA